MGKFPYAVWTGEFPELHDADLLPGQRSPLNKPSAFRHPIASATNFETLCLIDAPHAGPVFSLLLAAHVDGSPLPARALYLLRWRPREPCRSCST